jgi:hypothetical protein
VEEIARDWSGIDLKAHSVDRNYFLVDEAAGRSYHHAMIRKVTVMASCDMTFEAIEHMNRCLYVTLMGTYDCNFLVDCLGKSRLRRYRTSKNGASQAIPLEIAVLC